jgi:hypothetical protein
MPTRKTLVTTWAPRGTKPTIVSGRWVQLGGPTVINYWLTGLPGGKVYFSRSYPFVRYQRNDTDINNCITAMVNEDDLEFPKGVGADGMIKALFGQRKIRSFG